MLKPFLLAFPIVGVLTTGLQAQHTPPAPITMKALLANAELVDGDGDYKTYTLRVDGKDVTIGVRKEASDELRVSSVRPR